MILKWDFRYSREGVVDFFFVAVTTLLELSVVGAVSCLPAAAASAATLPWTRSELKEEVELELEADESCSSVVVIVGPVDVVVVPVSPCTIDSSSSSAPEEHELRSESEWAASPVNSSSDTLPIRWKSSPIEDDMTETRFDTIWFTIRLYSKGLIDSRKYSNVSS